MAFFRVPAKSRVALLLIGAATACATAPRSADDGAGDGAGAGPGAGAPKYPRRPHNCKLAVFHTATPGVPSWDDLGVAEVGCQLDTGVQQCMQRLREEACRMGGDIIYALPAKPLRPKDQVLVYRGHVAHTRAKVGSNEGAKDGAKQTDEPAAPDGQDAGPIEPLVVPSARTTGPVAPGDGGTG